MESDSGEFIERTNFEEEESKLSRTFFMFVYSVVFHFDEILFIIFAIFEKFLGLYVGEIPCFGISYGPYGMGPVASGRGRCR